MTFQSAQFFLFFALLAPLYLALPARVQWPALLIASYAFYAAGELRYLPVLMLVTAVSYFAARAMIGKTKKEEKKRPMWIGVGLCLLILFFFKYYDLAVAQLAPLVGMPSLAEHKLGLPLGISFFTLAAMSYVIDCQRGWTQVEPNAGRQALFIAFFPLILSGPIERAPRLMKQLYAEHRFDESRVVSGLLLFAWGMFKKVVVADRLAVITAGAFADAGHFSGWGVLIATSTSCIQLYGDFSGYSDMAIGLSKVLGIDVMENFKRPFLAASIEDLWGKRWHLALTSWMKDYVFNPLSYLMRRQPATRRHLIILVVFFLTGLWHGATLKFMAWGLINGLFVLSHVLSAARRKVLVEKLGLAARPRLHRVLSTGFTVSLFGLGAIVFLAPNFADAVVIYSRLFSGWGPGALLGVKDALLAAHGSVNLMLAAFGVAVLFAVELAQEQKGSLRELIMKRPIWVRWPVYYALVLTIAWLGAFQREVFIYQQF